MCATWASPMSNFSPSASIRSTARGAISRPGCSRRPAGSARRRILPPWSTPAIAKGIGVLLDWVPGHFPDDPHGLGHFDGTALYEHANPLQGRHLDWGTLIYNYGRTEVVEFPGLQRAVLARALRHRRAARRRGRLDALSRLQPAGRRLDSEPVRRARKPRGDRVPAPLQHRGVRAISRGHHGCGRIDRMAAGVAPGRIWRARLRLQVEHGLDARHACDTSARIRSTANIHHGDILFGLHYAFSENFILPLSHDEVVHGKRSILGRMPGDDWQRFANLRAYYGFMFGHPGKKLMFMGCEFGQEREWNHDHSLDWHLLEQPRHVGIQSLIRDLNQLYRAVPALHELDCDQAGFEWVVTDDADRNVFAWLRKGNEARARCLVVVNFSPKVYRNYRVRVPFAGKWHEVFNSDSAHYGGSNVGNVGEVADAGAPVPELNLDHSATGRDLSRTGKLRHATDGGNALPPRRQLGREGHQFRVVLGQRGEGRALPVRQPGPPRARAHRDARANRGRLARLSQRRLARPALWLPRPRALRARARAPLQSQQAAARPLRQAAGRPVGLERRAFRLSRRQRARGSFLRPARQCPRHAEGGGGRRDLQLGPPRDAGPTSPGKTPSSTRPTSRA